MKYWGRFPLFSLFLLFIAPIWVVAQAITCPSIVRAALAATDEFCAPTGRNQACYGNITLEAEAQPGVAGFQFDTPGDLVDVAQVKRLRLSPLDQQQEMWGVALMRIQANVPDTLPGQNVTFLLFGDVEIQNGILSPSTISVTAKSAVVVYEQPSDNSPILAGVVFGESLVANGRTADSEWLRIAVPGQHNLFGWIQIRTVTVGDISTLSIIDSAIVGNSTEDSFGPMQIFYFRSGFNDRLCAEVPDSGVLIQAPENAGPIELRVNDVDITLGSTAYLQAQPSGEMVVSVIEGGALIQANGELRTAPAGTQVRLSLDEALRVEGRPGPTEPYDAKKLQVLPVQSLMENIVVAPTMSQEQINQLGIPTAGEWMRDSIIQQYCPDYSQTWYEQTKTIIEAVNDDGFVVVNTENPNLADNSTQFKRMTSGFTYTAEWTDQSGWISAAYKYYVVSANHILGTVVSEDSNNCIYHISRDLKLQRAAIS